MSNDIRIIFGNLCKNSNSLVGPKKRQSSAVHQRQIASYEAMRKLLPVQYLYCFTFGTHAARGM